MAHRGLFAWHTQCKWEGMHVAFKEAQVLCTHIRWTKKSHKTKEESCRHADVCMRIQLVFPVYCRATFFWERRWWVTWCMNESCHTWMSHVTLAWCVMSHVNVSCHMWLGQVTHEWVMSHVKVSSHIWMGQVTREWVMWHVNMWGHSNESCDTQIVGCRALVIWGPLYIHCNTL